ncbi:MAG: porin [Gammaproteobacteria bacterium]
MKSFPYPRRAAAALALCAFCLQFQSVQAADKQLLDVLLANGAITQAQYEQLLESASTCEPAPSASAAGAQTVTAPFAEAPAPLPAVDGAGEGGAGGASGAAAVAQQPPADTAEDNSAVVSYGPSGFRLESRDGNWQTNLQWRAQFRYSNPTGGDPRQLADFDDPTASSFEPRRLRMKIGGHGYQPWIKYYFEVDLQPARDVDADPVSSGARVIDWRVDLAKWDWGGIRLGQWKVDLNRERVDSSGRQQFVERSIVNRIFTIDRQIGIQLRGRLFDGTPADLRYYAGIFNGEGRGVRNENDEHMYMGRLQWNFLGRDVPWRQTDVEYTEKPAASLALAGFTNVGACTRWSSSGCGNLDGFASPFVAEPGQFKIDQWVQEFALKYRGLSIQQEYHRKNIDDRVLGTKSELTGAYVQAGYFFHQLFPSWPAPLELAARYAYVEEPNRTERSIYNERREYTVGANWFFSGHNNKLTLDYSYLTMDDPLAGEDGSQNRVRLQWDVSF